MPRRARFRPDNRPPRDVDVYVPPPNVMDRIQGQQELVDRSPPEVKRVFWEMGFDAGFAAFHEWRRNRARRGAGGSSATFGAIFTRK